MGIASRKAGTVVRCPKCAGEIIVPIPDGAAGPENASEQATGGNAFDVERLDPGAFPEPSHGSVGATAATPKEPILAPTETAPTPAPVPASAPPQRLGVFVPLGMLIISLGVIVLLLIAMLILGLLIGRATMIPVEIKSAAKRPTPQVRSSSPAGLVDHWYCPVTPVFPIGKFSPAPVNTHSGCADRMDDAALASG